MKIILLGISILISMFVIGQGKEISVKTDLRFVIYKGDQYKKWYGQFHKNDLNQTKIENADGTPLKGYELKWEKEKDRARIKEEKAKIFHEVIIPVEIILVMNIDSLPVPSISKIKLKNHKDSLITVNFIDASFENVSLSNGSGYSYFKFHIDFTNHHFRKNKKGLKVYKKGLWFSGHVNYNKSIKGGVNASYSGNVYTRGDYSIYKVDGKKYSFIPFLYRMQYDFERKLKSFKYN